MSLYSYSERLSWSFFKNAYSQAIDAKRAADSPLLDLSLSNPTTALGPAYPHEAIRQAFSRIDSFLYEPNPCGLIDARRAIADYYRETGILAAEEDILLTASTSEAYALLFKLFCDP